MLRLIFIILFTLQIFTSTDGRYPDEKYNTLPVEILLPYNFLGVLLKLKKKTKI